VFFFLFFFFWTSPPLTEGEGVKAESCGQVMHEGVLRDDARRAAKQNARRREEESSGHTKRAVEGVEQRAARGERGEGGQREGVRTRHTTRHTVHGHGWQEWQGVAGGTIINMEHCSTRWNVTLLPSATRDTTGTRSSCQRATGRVPGAGHGRIALPPISVLHLHLPL
jgi:hypothetical protein